MYLLEPLLNRFYRRVMRSALQFDAGSFAVPPPRGGQGDCLLYVHIPFCEALCPYCSFHRYAYEPARAAAYTAALLQELRMYKNLGYAFTALYIGGGTPTIHLDSLACVLDTAATLFPLREISVETNPNHVTDANVALLKAAGVQRLSIGIQSFDDAVLGHLGRLVRYGCGRDIIDRVRGVAGVFDTLNIDLMFNIPSQTPASLKRDLDIIDDLLPDQVTFYPLMAAPSVAQTLRHKVGAVSFSREKRLYALVLERMRRSYSAATAWCFSRRQSMIDEYIVTHDAYVGAGSGAFGYFNGAVSINTFSLDEYCHRIAQGLFPVTRVKKFTARENMYYYVLMKLFGLSLDKKAFETLFGRSFAEALGPAHTLLKLSGAIVENDTTVTLTDRGAYYWVMAMREFFIAVDTMRDYCRSLAEP